jgi:hypothetical protein
MMFRNIAAACAALLTLMPVVAASAAAPKELYGKSVLISWNETRVQRLVSEEGTRNVAAVGEMTVYVSEAGRPFTRLRYSVVGRKGRLRTGKKDAVSGEGGPPRAFSFRGRTMTLQAKRGRGGALQFTVDFDGGFQGCSASVLAGRAPGGSIHGKSLITGNRVEILSVEASGASCRIVNGNTFAD